MSFIYFLYILIFLFLPYGLFFFLLYNDYTSSLDKILKLSNEIHVLQEKQNILLCEVQKLIVDADVVETTSSTFLTNTNIFYGLLGLTVVILVGLILYNWGSGGGTAGLFVDSAKVETNLVSDCTKVLSDGIVKLGDHLSDINNLTAIPLSNKLITIQLQILHLESKIDTLALNCGASGELTASVIKTMHENSGSVL